MCPPEYKSCISLSPPILAQARAAKEKKESQLLLLEIHCLQTHKPVVLLEIPFSFPLLFMIVAILNLMFYWFIILALYLILTEYLISYFTEEVETIP